MKPVLSDITKCTGCKACEQICMSGAISMQLDNEGFSYPAVDESKCVNCGLCMAVCPTENRAEFFQAQEVFAAVHKNKKILQDSSSGGVFSAIADAVLENGGVVVGCAFDSDFRARQVVVENKALLGELRGSKYVQSDTGDTYARTKALLEQGITVFYSGTPCQIAGLKAFIGKENEKLLTADFVCHGVPSPELFVQHIDWLEKRNRHKIRQYRFRSKVSPSRQSTFDYCYHILGYPKVQSGSAVLDPYYFNFLNGRTYRNCCYQCPYAGEQRVSDITFADYWNVERFHPGLTENCGVSILMINTEKGKAYLPALNKKMQLIPSKLEWIKQINYNLNRPAERPDLRDTVYLEIGRCGYQKWADNYCATLQWKMRYGYNKLPGQVKKTLKRILIRKGKITGRK